jgi:DNA-binding transcriptional regulator YbjK
VRLTNRERAVQAAIDLLGTEGVRALTHGRVDERAALPRGSTSNYFRTRAALFEGVVDAMVASELPAVQPAFSPRTADELVDGLVRLFEFLTGPQRVMTAARLALFVEAGHDDVLSAQLARGRAAMEEQIRPAFVALGAPDPDLATQVLATTFEGMFVHVIARHAAVDVPQLITLIVRAALGLSPLRS